jgi:hypothetical protein
MPWPQFFPVPFYTLNNRYCWEGFPEYPKNYYNDPVYWWPHFQIILLQLKPTGRCPMKEAYTPTKFPQIPPVEAVVKTPAPITQLTPTPAVEQVQTIAITLVRTYTLPATFTIATTVPVREIDWPTTAGIGVAVFIVGIAVGYLILRRRS